MHRRIAALGIIVAMAALAGSAVKAAGHYAKVGETSIGGAGTFDYLTVDPKAGFRASVATHTIPIGIAVWMIRPTG